MSDENKGVIGPSSLRIGGRKVSELPLGLGAEAVQQIPGFLEEARRNKVNAIIARYPKASVAYCEGAMRECEQNLKTFAVAKNTAMKNIGDYMDLMKNRQGDLTQEEVDAMTSEIVSEWIESNKADPELVRDGRPIPGTFGFHQLMAKLKPINARLRLYVDEELWKQVGLFQEERDRYDDAARKETDAIFQLRETVSLLHERDRLIRRAMTEPLAVE